MSVYDLSMGLLFDANVVSAALYGAGCLQGWFYYRKFGNRDKWWIRWMVITIISLDTAQQGMLSASVYHYTVTKHDDPTAIAYMDDKILYCASLGGIIGLFTQCFYCYRIWNLSNGNIFSTGFLVIMTMATFVSLQVFIAISVRYQTWAELGAISAWSESINVIGALTDIFISIFMVYYLQNMKTAFRRTNDVLNQLIVFTFSAGIPTSACALAAFISIKASPKTFIYIFFYLLVGRFYTNTLLVTLNTREYLRGNLNNDNIITMTSYNDSRSRSDQRPNSSGFQSSNAIEVRLDQSVETDAPKEARKSTIEV